MKNFLAILFFFIVFICTPVVQCSENSSHSSELSSDAKAKIIAAIFVKNFTTQAEIAQVMTRLNLSNAHIFSSVATPGERVWIRLSCDEEDFDATFTLTDYKKLGEEVRKYLFSPFRYGESDRR